MNPADLWELLTKNGIAPDSATAIVKTHAGMNDADLWQRLVQNGAPDSAATQIVDARRGGATSQVSTPAAPRTADAFFDHLVQGVTFGTGRNILAAVDKAIGHGSYGDNLAQINARLDAERGTHPAAAVSGDVGGAVLSPINELIGGLPFLRAASAPTTLAGKLAQAAKSGAAIGAAAGAGNANGSMADHAKAALAGALTGGLAGAAIAPVAAGASGALRAVQRSPSDVILPAMQRAGTDVTAVAADRPSMLADVLPDLTRTVRSMSPLARQAIDPALAARRAQQLPDITDALESGLGVQRGSIQQSVNDIIAKRAGDAAPMYARAYEAPDITDPAVLETMRLPQFQQAYRVAQRIAHTEGSPLPDLPTNDIPIPAALKDNPDAVAAFEKAYRAQNPAGGAIPVRAVDLVKRGLNDVIDAGLRSGNMGRAEARALQSRLSDMLTRVDATAPEYAQARAVFAGHSNLADAAQAGQEFMSSKVGAADVAAHLADLSPSEQELYRRGAIESLMTKLESARGSATGRADLVSRFYSSVGGRAKVQALFPSAAAYQTFDKAMDRLASQNETSSFITGGSQTADKAAQQELFTSAHAARTAADFIRHPLRATLAATANAADRSLRVGSQRTAADVAPALVAMGPQLDALLRTLRAAPTSAARDAILVNAVGRRAGAVAGSLRGLLGPD